MSARAWRAPPVASLLALTLSACSLVREGENEDRAGAAIERDRTPAAAQSPPPPDDGPPDARAERIASLAEGFLGVPYRYGGASPRGFDCSGLVLYVHALAGLTVPRTAAGQMLAARRIAPQELRRGDLVFFASGGARRPIDHVGVYVGQGWFVHAPRTGRPVTRSRLDEAWYAARFAGAGRFR